MGCHAAHHVVDPGMEQDELGTIVNHEKAQVEKAQVGTHIYAFGGFKLQTIDYKPNAKSRLTDSNCRADKSEGGSPPGSSVVVITQSDALNHGQNKHGAYHNLEGKKQNKISNATMPSDAHRRIALALVPAADPTP